MCSPASHHCNSCAACDNWLIGEDLSGNDIGSVSGVDRYACLAACQETVGCGAFTHNFFYNSCHLKSELPSTLISAATPYGISLRICSILQVPIIPFLLQAYVQIGTYACRSCTILHALSGLASAPFQYIVYRGICYFSIAFICLSEIWAETSYHCL